MIEPDAIARRPSIAAMSTWTVVAVMIVVTAGAIGGVAAAEPSASSTASSASNATAASNGSATEAAPPGALVSSAIAVQEARTSQSYQEALIEEDLDRADSPAARERVRRAHLAALERDARRLSADWNRTRDGYASGSVPASVYRVKMTGSAARANALRRLVERSATDETESDRIVRELPGSGSAADRDWTDQSGRPTPARQPTASGPDRGAETVPDGPWSEEWPDPWADESDDRPGTNRSAGSDDRDDESDDAESADGHEHRGSPPPDGWETGDQDDRDGPENVVPANPADSEVPADPSREDARDDSDEDRDDSDDGRDADDSADGAGPPVGGPEHPGFGDDADEDSAGDRDEDEEDDSAGDRGAADDDDAEEDPAGDRGDHGDSAGDRDDDEGESTVEQGETGFSGDPGVEELHPELADSVSNETASNGTA